jgi:hypothetical protein
VSLAGVSGWVKANLISRSVHIKGDSGKKGKNRFEAWYGKILDFQLDDYNETEGEVDATHFHCPSVLVLWFYDCSYPLHHLTGTIEDSELLMMKQAIDKRHYLLAATAEPAEMSTIEGG